MTLADRLVVLNGGLVEQVGTPIELYEKPATTFVATFIGSPSMNLFSFEKSKFLDSGTSVAPAGTKMIGIRPEDLHIAHESDQAAIRMEVRVSAVELVGAESYVHGRLADDTPLIFRVPGRSQIGIDELVVVAAQPQSVHYFNDGNRRIEE
jgi:sn-glycerol 3-phosphate transport system ATP-binding protein